jgi:large subunit ribosomal protein L25
MAKEIRMKAAARPELGTTAARRLRRTGVLPAAVKRLSGVSESVGLDAHAFENTMRHHSGDTLLVTLDLGGADVTTLLREVQHDVISGLAIHADFGEISLTKKLRASILIKLVGEADGVKTGGGILEQTLRHVDVECLPADLVEAVEVDVSALKLGQSLTVGAIALGPGYTVLTNAGISVATVVAPAAEEVVEVVEGAVAAGAEPEVITKGKKEEAEEAAGADKKAAGADKKASEKKG